MQKMRYPNTNVKVKYYDEGVSKMGVMVRVYFIFLLMLSATILNAQAKETSKWPQSFKTEKEMVNIYNPSLEESQSNTLSARAAFSIKETDKNPVFGALWFKAGFEKTGDKLTLSNLEIQQMKVPDYKDAEIEALVKRLEIVLNKNGLKLSAKD